MSTVNLGRRMFRCAGCGKYTRRSRCSACRVRRDAAKVDARGGRYTKRADRRKAAR